MMNCGSSDVQRQQHDKEIQPDGCREIASAVRVESGKKGWHGGLHARWSLLLAVRVPGVTIP